MAAVLDDPQAMQSDLLAALDDIEEVYGLRITPEDGLRVTDDGRGYRIDAGRVTFRGAWPGNPPVLMSVDSLTLRLAPDSANPDRIDYALTAVPATSPDDVWTLAFDTLDVSGQWSVDLAMPVAGRVLLSGLQVEGPATLFGYEYEADPMVLALDGFDLAYDTTREVGDAWTLESNLDFDDLEIRTIIDVNTVVVVDRVARHAATTRITGIPLASWRDYIAKWLPVVVEAERTGVDTGDDVLQAFVSEAPPMFGQLQIDAESTDLGIADFAAARVTDTLTLTQTGDGLMDATSRTVVTGISLRPTDPVFQTIEPVAGALMPTAFSVELGATQLPFATDLMSVLETLPQWLQMPDADLVLDLVNGAENRVDGANTHLDLTADWPNAHVNVAVELTANANAERGVVGRIDSAVSGMEHFGSSYNGHDPQRIAAGLALLQALGQREIAQDGTTVITRYLVEIAENGLITLNGRDFGPALQMIRGQLQLPDDFITVPAWTSSD